jgi:hypothetical protein
MLPMSRLEMDGTTDRVDFWFDPICPYCWITSRWMVEVERIRPVTVHWWVMSLGVLNTRTPVDPEVRPILELSKGPARVMAATAAGHGPEVLGPLYSALGERLHGVDGLLSQIRVGLRDGREVWDAALRRSTLVIADTLADLGLPRELSGAAELPRWDEELTASHARVPVGDATPELIGVPTIAVDGRPGYFGPVLAEIPDPASAGRIWDAFRILATEDSFFELKRVAERAMPQTTPTGAHRPASGAEPPPAPAAS